MTVLKWYFFYFIFNDKKQKQVSNMTNSHFLRSFGGEIYGAAIFSSL